MLCVKEHRRLKLEGKAAPGAASRQETRRNLYLLLYHYWHRLLGTALGWFAWDFYYCEHPHPCSQAPVSLQTSVCTSCMSMTSFGERMPLKRATCCADGNKLFQSEFINVIHPGSNLLGLLEYNLLNSSVALFGYYFAAFTIDRVWMGRRRMQVSEAVTAPCIHTWNAPYIRLSFSLKIA